VGNGRLLAGFDGAGVLRTLTGPHLDYPQHLHSSSLRLDVPGLNGMARRLNGLGWRHEQDYLPGTNVLRTLSTAPNGLKIEQRAVAIGDALVIGIELCRSGRSPAGVALVWELGLQVGGRLHANALRYLPDSDALIAYQREFAIAVGATPALDHVLSKDRGLGGTNGSRQGGAPLTAIGQVSAEIRLRLQRSQLTILVIALGQPMESLPKMIELRHNLEGSREWPAELAPNLVRGTIQAAQGLRIPDLGPAQAELAECYQRSVLTIRQLTDRSGAILAGPPIDEGFARSGGYAFCWPRDGAFIAQGLDAAGDQQAASNFFSWALSVQPEDGIWRQRYYADGVEAPSWATHQLDETGTLLWALDQHLHKAFDAKLMARGLEAAVRAYRGVSNLADESGWPPSTQNLWEDREGTHLYTLAALLAGARAWNQRARTSKTAGTHVFAHAESQLEKALAGWPVHSKSGVMARAVVTSPRRVKPDFTVDASLLGLSVPFGILDPTDRRLTGTVEAIERDLVTSTGRVRRYVGDTYRGGNAWPLLGLWLAWHKLRVGDRGSAIRLYRRVLNDRTPAGLIAEQVDARTGQALWVVPLPWAHAWFLVVSHELADIAAEKRVALQRKPSANGFEKTERKRTGLTSPAV
jgi:hypothetical protein